MQRRVRSPIDKYFLGITIVFVLSIALPTLNVLVIQRQTPASQAAPNTAEQAVTQVNPATPPSNQIRTAIAEETSEPSVAAGADNDDSLVTILWSPANREVTLGFATILGLLFLLLGWMLIKGRPNWHHFSSTDQG